MVDDHDCFRPKEAATLHGICANRWHSAESWDANVFYFYKMS